MVKTIDEIKDVMPDINSERVEDLSNELDRVLELKTLFNSKGGKQLITLLKNNCAVSLRKLVKLAREKPEIDSLLSVIFEYSANLDLLATLGDLSLEEELRKQLDEAVKDAMR